MYLFLILTGKTIYCLAKETVTIYHASCAIHLNQTSRIILTNVMCNKWYKTKWFDVIYFCTICLFFYASKRKYDYIIQHLHFNVIHVNLPVAKLFKEYTSSIYILTYINNNIIHLYSKCRYSKCRYSKFYNLIQIKCVNHTKQ